MFLTLKRLRPLRFSLLAVLLCLVGLVESGSASAAHKPTKSHKPAASAASSAAPVEARRGELKDLQGRLEKLNQDLAKTEESQAYASDQLKETESAISNANRSLRELAEQRGATEAALSDLQQQAQRLESQISFQQGQLGQLLYRQYVNGEIDALQLLLSGGNANQAARDLHYMTLLSRAKADLLGVLRVSLDEKQRLSEATRGKREELAGIEQKQQQQRATLLAQQQQRQTMLAGLTDKLKSQRREIDTLKRDEKRLARLIEGLARIVADRTRAREKEAARRQAAAAARAAKMTARKAAPGKSAAQAEAPEPIERNERNERSESNQQEPVSFAYSGNFTGLKGRLRLPIRGELANRFGAPRAEGGATWKGIFIRAAEGAEVKALAPGRVVFADWLRGFGNLLIIDHGDAYLSVYGNNQSLFRHVGDLVKAGDAIAAVGNSGGNPESGLYFELRQQGHAIDPLKWVSLK